MRRKAKAILLKKMSQKKMVSQWIHSQKQISSSSEEEGAGKAGKDGDLSKMIHLVGRLAKGEKAS